MDTLDIKGKVLVVDDDSSNIDIITTMLKSSYQIVSASNGKEALAELKKIMPDFVITDWDMPVMNGLELVKSLKQENNFKHIPVIMMTGLMTETDHLLEAYNAGVIDFIRKPFDFLELKARTNAIYQLAKFYKEELNSKNRELVSYAIRLAEINEFLLDIISKADEINHSSIVEELKEVLNSKISDSIWNQFNSHFEKIYPHFISNLNKKHQGLTPAELILASLLRLNLNTKEIASILHQTPESIKVARARLRKKLNLDTDENLSVYLLQY